MSFVLGGFLSGLGAGIAKQGEMAAEERRKIALENLRSQNQLIESERAGEISRQNQTHSADLTDRNNSRQVVRTTDATIKTEGVKHGYRTAEKAQDFQYDQRLERLRSSLRTSEDAAKQRLADQLDAGDLKDVVVGEDGFYYTVSQSGGMKATGIKASPKEYNGSRSGEDGDGTALGRARAGQGGDKPTAKGGLGNPGAAGNGQSREIDNGPVPSPSPNTAPIDTAPRRAAAPAQARQAPRQGNSAARDFANANGVDPGRIVRPGALPMMMTDAQMERFVNDPKNKGRQVIGPDGEVHTVK